MEPKESEKNMLLLEILQRIEDQLELIGPQKDRIKAIKTELWFLDIYLRLNGKQKGKKCEPFQRKVAYLDDCPELHILKDVMWNTTVALPDQLFDYITSNMLKRIQHSKLEIRASYSYPETGAIISHLTHELVEEYIDNVVHNLNDLLIVRLCELLAGGTDSSKNVMYFQVKSQMEVVEKELIVLKNFVCFRGKRCRSEKQPEWRTFLSHVEAVATHAAMISFLYLPNLSDGKPLVLEFTTLLSDLLEQKIKPIELRVRKIYTDVLIKLSLSLAPPMSAIEAAAEFLESLQYILAKSKGLVPLTEDQSESLSEQLNSLRTILNELPLINHIQHEKRRIHCLRQLETLIIEAGVVIYSLYDNRKGKKVGSRKLLVLADNIQRVKKEFFQSIRDWVKSHLPKNDAFSFFNLLLDSLKDFLGSHSDSLASVNKQFKVAYDGLESFQPFLKEVAEQGINNNEQLQELAVEVMSKAYEVEYIVDCFAVRDVPLTYLTIWLSEIIEEIKNTKTELSNLKKKMAIAASPTNEELVGFEDVRKTIRGQLVGGSRQLDVISIVGMPGSGKTTLARSFIDDDSIVSRFDFRAECRVSQVYTGRDLLLSILNDTMYVRSDHFKESESESELADRLRKTLLRKRYLLIIDDVWDIHAWDSLRLCFPDCKNGSRIILTTRMREVSVYAKHFTDPHELRLFQKEESWLLLHKKVFGKESCPKELRKVGQEIAKKCKGLPLSVVLVAGILTRTDKEEQCWKQVKDSLGEQIVADSKVLVQFSYDDLPDKLKPCFLYFGAFLEDREILVSKLTSLWIAEGFIENNKQKGLEDIAEDYLKDLIGRNLVMVTKNRSIGKIKACRVHDLLLEFCKEKAMKENFLLWLKRDYSSNIPCFYSEQPMHRRLSFCSNRDKLTGWSPSCSHARSVFFREVGDNTFSLMGHASIIFGSFKFLRVLDLEYIVVDSFPTELNNLRYFAVQTVKDSVPSSIENLWNLETFLVRAIGGQVLLPDTFWKLLKLRHVRISNKAVLDGGLCPSKLEMLATLSSPYFSSAEEMERIVKKMPNLRKLRCIFSRSWGCAKNDNRFPTLDILPQLETLKVLFFHIPKVGPSRLNFPSSLKKLTLCRFPLPNAEILTIANLRTLEILKLKEVAFEKDEWEVNGKEFPQLKFLELHDLKFSEWRVADEAFPCLERLILRKCLHLEAIPSYFMDTENLQRIEVRSCKQSVANSAKNIGETQVETYQRCDFEVFIQQ